MTLKSVNDAENHQISELLRRADEDAKEEKKDLNMKLAYEKIENNVAALLGTKVKIVDKNNKGKIQIEYYSAGDLERIVKIISGGKKIDL